MNGLYYHHAERLSSHPRVLKLAQQINRSFLRSGLTELRKLDPEYESVALQDAAGKIASIIVFYRYDDLDDTPTYYLPIVWTAPAFRGQKCYERLLEWLKAYAKGKKVKRISTDVHHDNERMIRLKERHWEKTFVRFNLAI